MKETKKVLNCLCNRLDGEHDKNCDVMKYFKEELKEERENGKEVRVMARKQGKLERSRGFRR